MRFIVYRLAITTLVLGVSACATTTPSHNYLDPEARPHIKTVDSVLVAHGDEIGTNIKPSKLSTIFTGHIAPILIDIGVTGYRSIKAARLVKPMRESLEEYDFTTDLQEEFNEALVTSNVDGVGDIQLLQDEIPGDRALLIAESEADAVMFIDANHAFTPKFDALYLGASVFMIPVDPKLSPYKEEPDDDNVIEITDNIYRNKFVAVMTVPEPGSTSENAAFWAEMSDEELTFRMQAAVKKLAAHVADDLSIDDVQAGVSPDPVPNPQVDGSDQESSAITLDPTAPIEELEPAPEPVPEPETVIPDTDA